MSIQQHLKDSDTHYFEHARWALTAGFKLIWAGIASLVHAINPAWLPGTAAGIVIDLYHSRLHNHPNQSYQNLIREHLTRSTLE